MIVVLDSSVVVSGIHWRNESYRCLVALAHRDYVLAVSPPVFDEYVRTVWRVKESEAIAGNPQPWLDFLRRRAHLVEPVPLRRPVCRDAKDDKFLECALAAQAAYIVSRDEDLLVLEKPFGIAVVTPRKFLSILAAARRA
jgi:putative PIN family toxin of toxin-antitoxin system